MITVFLSNGAKHLPEHVFGEYFPAPEKKNDAHHVPIMSIR